MWKCPSCARELADRLTYCPQCCVTRNGVSLEEASSSAKHQEAAPTPNRAVEYKFVPIQPADGSGNQEPQPNNFWRNLWDPSFETTEKTLRSTALMVRFLGILMALATLLTGAPVVSAFASSSLGSGQVFNIPVMLIFGSTAIKALAWYFGSLAVAHLIFLLLKIAKDRQT